MNLPLAGLVLFHYNEIDGLTNHQKRVLASAGGGHGIICHPGGLPIGAHVQNVMHNHGWVWNNFHNYVHPVTGAIAQYDSYIRAPPVPVPIPSPPADSGSAPIVYIIIQLIPLYIILIVFFSIV